jgi:hypothetical protein
LSKLLGLKVQEAAMNSDLPSDVRHLIHVMAVSGNGETCVGWLSQASLARLMGCSERHVRSLLVAPESPESTPVRVERRARFRPEGRGRTSDEWKLVLVESTNRHTVPPERRSAGTPRTTNRHATHDQPAQRAGDPRSDPRSTCARRSATHSQQASLGLNEPQESAKPQEPSGYARATQAYFQSFEAARSKKPTFGEIQGKAIKKLIASLGADETIALIARVYAPGSWWRDKATICSIAADPDKCDNRAQAPRSGRPVQQGAAYDVDAAKRRGDALAEGLE